MSGPDPMRVAIGVDLGKRFDNSAIVITEMQPILMETDPPAGREPRTWPAGMTLPDGVAWIPKHDDTLYIVRGIEHVRLGTSYPKIARRIAEIHANLRDKEPDAHIYIAVDGTGVGAGPVDMLRELLGGRYNLTAVSYTAGDKCPSVPLFRREVTVGKAYLVVRAQTILQKGLLKLPKGEQSEALVQELQDFEVKTSANGHDSYNARPGRHDDLVNALLLSLLGDAVPGVQYGPSIYQ